MCDGFPEKARIVCGDERLQAGTFGVVKLPPMRRLGVFCGVAGVKHDGNDLAVVPDAGVPVDKADSAGAGPVLAWARQEDAFPFPADVYDATQMCPNHRIDEAVRK